MHPSVNPQRAPPLHSFQANSGQLHLHPKSVARRTPPPTIRRASLPPSPVALSQPARCRYRARRQPDFSATARPHPPVRPSARACSPFARRSLRSASVAPVRVLPSERATYRGTRASPSTSGVTFRRLFSVSVMKSRKGWSSQLQLQMQQVLDTIIIRPC